MLKKFIEWLKKPFVKSEDDFIDFDAIEEEPEIPCCCTPKKVSKKKKTSKRTKK